jgi:uncharacterized protein YndB with AHSA1/START domain
MERATLARRRDYYTTAHYQASRQRVFDAAATPSGPSGWWTTRGENVTGAGNLMRLQWSDQDYILFQLEEIDRPTTMRWRCIEQHDRNLTPPDEWVGTTLSFRFVDEGDVTRLDFVHEGLVPALRCFTVCENGWEFFLRRSLRQLVEAGEGLPFEVPPRS